MAFDYEKYHRRSMRLASHNYRAAGAYFVTVCAAQKRCIFGHSHIENGAVRLHPYGRMVESCWHALPQHFPHVDLDEFQVMPNHFHGILIFTDDGIEETRDVGARLRRAPTSASDSVRRFGGSQAGSLGVVVGQMKLHVTRNINDHRAEHNLSPVKVWHRNFYDHIIRDEKELNAIRRYIIENPMRWENDRENPNA